MPLAPGSLHCVSGWSASRSQGPVIEEAVRNHVAGDEVRHLYSDVYLVYTDAGAARPPRLANPLAGGGRIVVRGEVREVVGLRAGAGSSMAPAPRPLRGDRHAPSYRYAHTLAERARGTALALRRGAALVLSLGAAAPRWSISRAPTATSTIPSTA